MKVKLTEHQMMIVQQMTRMSEAFANELYHIMQNHGLDKVNGCRVIIDVSPKHPAISRDVTVGSYRSDFGFVNVIRGDGDNDYKIFYDCSEEYESLLDREARNTGRKGTAPAEKPLPPDGLWVGDDRNAPAVDRVGNWEWDVNDSLS